jgi:hypothetical protein
MIIAMARSTKNPVSVLLVKHSLATVVHPEQRKISLAKPEPRPVKKTALGEHVRAKSYPHESCATAKTTIAMV